ncbi:hypothetical protein SAMN05192588_0629 [Nonlabens sp. Hel1_33_55]|uniref:hypothetical protein n=1 Tax=Nonlabens sp. Hel1_33_55 TaxID=1336802 RepID=UPI000875EA90|nr:hypothetical protein [Nonlabens sp. Hel1_33_55]SCX99431.1 hypothetical protein SAMN05192588_0629 [Nonlabens sp. Hel1_33_55]
MKQYYTFVILLALVLTSCSVHKRSYIQGDEEFVVEMKKPGSRGGMVEIALQGLFLGADYLAVKTAKSLTSSYSQALSINDYYYFNSTNGTVTKTYNEIHIKKYEAPANAEKKAEIVSTIKSEIDAQPKPRGTSAAAAAFTFDDNVLRIQDDKEDLLNFEAVIEILTDSENPGVSRLSFNELRILFSRTKIYEDENLNARLSVSITGQWRNKDNTPMEAVLVEQEYDLRNLKYGPENQIQTPILSPWYVDIPYLAEDEFQNYGIVKVNVQLQEYEGGKSKYINQLPSILSDNKDSVIKSGSATIQKILGN